MAERDIDEATRLVNNIHRLNQEFENVTVDIAVTGRAGAGKSSLINTIRGMESTDEGGAEVESVETTMEPTSYEFPLANNVKIWDLPGLGTPKITRDNYVNIVKLDSYDFFLIVAQKRFTDDDLWLAKEISAIGKKFFFVRTHIDCEVDNGKKKDNFKEDDLLAKIRENVKKHVEEANIASHLMEEPEYVYLISTKLENNEKWDFGKMTNAMVNAISGVKREVFLLSLCNFSPDLIKKKCDILRSRIWRVASVCGAAGALPIPIVDILASNHLLRSTVTNYKTYLGLDDASLRRLSYRTRVPYETLVSTADQYLKFSVATVSSAMIKYYGAGAAKVAMSVGIRWIPVIGSIIGTGVSFGTTYALLRNILSDLERAAEQVLITVLKSYSS